MTALTAQNLRVALGRRLVLDDLSLSLSSGHLVARTRARRSSIIAGSARGVYCCGAC